jgi:hypothetical protein
LILFCLAALSFYTSYRNLEFGRRRKHKTPEKMVENFYAIALNSEPLAVSKLVALLHPSTAWVLLQDRNYADVLRDEWYRVRRECARVGGNAELPSPWIYKIFVNSGSDPDNYEVVVATRYGMNAKSGGREIFYFANRLLAFDGSWAMVEPFPGVMTPVKSPRGVACM